MGEGLGWIVSTFTAYLDILSSCCQKQCMFFIGAAAAGKSGVRATLG